MARKADYVIKNADIRWRNFSERVNTRSQYDRDRGDGKSINGGSFAIFLPDDIVAELRALNVAVREYKHDDKPDTPLEHFINVTVQFDPSNPWKNPTIWQISGDNHVKLDENTMGNLDYAEIDNVDVTLNFGSNIGKYGRKVYLNTAYVTLSSNTLADQYGF